MIHYHGLPITPEDDCCRIIKGRHAFVSFHYPAQLGVAATVAQSFAVDNGAFTAWKKGKPVDDWGDYYEFVHSCMALPNFDWAVIPDVIDGSEKDNNTLLSEWPSNLPGVPVFHLHESEDRLMQLMEWPRIAIGSSGQYASIGTAKWWQRMAQIMKVVCREDGSPMVKLHGLRMLSPNIYSHFPFSSADSATVGLNVGLDVNFKGFFAPKNKWARGLILADQLESGIAPSRWCGEPEQTLLEGV